MRNVKKLIRSRLFNYDISETIVVAGSPRSGTTWLAELLAATPGYTLLNEPLKMNFAEVRGAGFERRTYIDPLERRPEAEMFMEKVLRGQIGAFPWPVGRWKTMKAMTNRKLVVKFVRVNRLLNWLCRVFPVKGSVVIIRHPCAVVASQISLGERENSAWKYMGPPGDDKVQTGYGGWIPDEVVTKFEDVFKKVKTREGALATMWCLDNYFPLTVGTVKPWILTTYERLATDAVDEAVRIFKKIGIDKPKGLEMCVKTASGAAGYDLRVDAVNEQLAKWKEKLRQKHVDEILGIVHGFGLDFYTEQIEPDYDRLNRFVVDHASSTCNI